MPRLFGANLRDSWKGPFSERPSSVFPCCFGKYESSLDGMGRGEKLADGDEDPWYEGCLGMFVVGLS